VLRARHEVGFLGRVELAELGLGAIQPDAVGGGLGEVHRDEPVDMGPMLESWPNHQMGESLIVRVDDHAY
jgi:hypothetical protein